MRLLPFPARRGRPPSSRSALRAPGPSRSCSAVRRDSTHHGGLRAPEGPFTVPVTWVGLGTPIAIGKDMDSGRGGGPSSVVGYAFGDGVLDVRAHQWLEGGMRRALEPKAFAVLLHLIEHRDRAVTKAELLDAVWHDARVCEGALPQCIWTVRRSIGDTNADRPLIATLKRVGYRFVAPLEVVRAELDACPAQRCPDTARRRLEVAFERVRLGPAEREQLRDLALACREFAEAFLE